MFCKNCKNPTSENDKLCTKCGTLIDPTEQTESKINFDKLNKSLKTAGNSITAIGWISIITNIFLYALKIFTKDQTNSILPRIDTGGLFIIIIVSSIFIILGNRISKTGDVNTKKYLLALLTISVIVLIWIFTSGGVAGILFFIAIGYMIYSLIMLNKAMKNDEYTKTLTNPQHKINKKGWIIFTIVSLLLVGGAMGFDIYMKNKDFTKIKNSNGPEKMNLVKNITKEAKSTLNLPQKVDEVTEWVDMTPEPSAIRYHYVLTNVDKSKISTEQLKSMLITAVCKNPEVKNLFDLNIATEYSYTVKDTGDVYLISINNSDCVK